MHRLWVWGVLGWAGAVWAASETFPKFHEITSEVTTPHVAWARPLAGGPIRLLVIGPHTGQRETVELAQRLEVSYRAVSIYSPGALGSDSPGSGDSETPHFPDTREEAVRVRLRQALDETYDVAVLGLVRWEVLPPEVRYQLLLRVKQDGMGLVIVSPLGADRWLEKLLSQRKPAPAEIVGAVPLGSLAAFARYKTPEEAAAAIVGCRLLGQGRLVTLTYPTAPAGVAPEAILTPDVARVQDWQDVHYEYYQSLVAKAVRWAARRQTGVTVGRVTAPSGPVDRAALSSTRVPFELDASAGRRVVLRWTARRPDGRVEWTREEPAELKPGPTVVAPILPPLPGGGHYIDLQVLQNGQVLDWASAFLTVAVPIGVASVQTDKPLYERSEQTRVTVDLTGKAGADHRVSVELVDRQDRLVARAERSAVGTDRVEIALPLAHVRSLAVRALATLHDPAGAVSYAHRSLIVADRQWEDDFGLVIWTDINPNRVARLGNRLGADLFGGESADIGSFGNWEADRPMYHLLAEAGLRPMPYVTRIWSRQTAPGHVRVPCLTDPRHYEPLARALSEAGRVLKDFSPVAYTLGDENDYGGDADTCRSPTCLAGFRQWLKAQYGTVAALNREWDTAYRSFDEAVPALSAEAKTPGQQASWVDHRLYITTVYTDMHRRLIQAIQQSDPGARVGLDGSAEPHEFGATDYAQLIPSCGMYVSYHQALHVECMRSFHRRGALTGVWWGGYIGQISEDQQRWYPWYMLMHGLNSAWWFRMRGCYAGVLSPDLSLMPAARWSLPELEAIRGGLGKLLLQARREHNGIAVYYSQASYHAGRFECPGWSPTAAATGLLALIEDLGLQYEMMSYDQVARGELAKRGMRALVMPNVLALSDREALEVRRFVEQGGLVVADVRPGVRDEHGRPRAQSALNEVFGADIRSGAPVPSGLATLQARAEVDGIALPADVSELRPGPRVEATRGQAVARLAGQPAVIVHRLGQGRAVLLGFDASAYLSDRKAVRAGRLRELLARVLEAHGVRPEVTVTADGRPVPGCEVVQWSAGRARYVALLDWHKVLPAQARKVQVRFPGPGHVYECWHGRSIGQVDQVETLLEPARVQVYAWLPYPVGPVEVKGSPRVARGEVQTVEVRVGLPAEAAPHVVRVEVFDPAGRRLHFLAQRLFLKDGLAQATIPIAFNDPVGRWTVRATEVVSGATAALDFLVH